MEANKTPQLSIVIPAYNEAESLPELLQQIHDIIKEHDYTNTFANYPGFSSCCV